MNKRAPEFIERVICNRIYGIALEKDTKREEEMDNRKTVEVYTSGLVTMKTWEKKQ